LETIVKILTELLQTARAKRKKKRNLRKEEENKKTLKKEYNYRERDDSVASINLIMFGLSSIQYPSSLPQNKNPFLFPALLYPLSLT